MGEELLFVKNLGRNGRFDWEGRVVRGEERALLVDLPAVVVRSEERRRRDGAEEVQKLPGAVADLEGE